MVFPDQLFIAYSQQGPWSFDISDPANPRRVFGEDITDTRGMSTYAIAPDLQRGLLYAATSILVVAYQHPAAHH